MEEEKASNNLADNQDCRGIVEKHYQNHILTRNKANISAAERRP